MSQPLQMYPLPKKPDLHEQLYPPTVLKQLALTLQLFCPVTHSSKSRHVFVALFSV
jgi:hypothetical protein